MRTESGGRGHCFGQLHWAASRHGESIPEQIREKKPPRTQELQADLPHQLGAAGEIEQLPEQSRLSYNPHQKFEQKMIILLTIIYILTKLYLSQ